jgi:gluconate 2-dehydrogenase gamma chain
MRRRTFFRAGLAAVATGIDTGCGKRGGGPSWRFFTPGEAATVDAICAQLIPADADPGASEARVANYIDTQLAKRFKKHRQTYRAGIAAIDATSRRLFAKPFVQLSPEQAVTILQDAEKNQRAFFDLILTHTRQGFYGDPRHGGNYRMASWKMLRLPFPQVRGREQ